MAGSGRIPRVALNNGSGGPGVVSSENFCFLKPDSVLGKPSIQL